MKWREGERERGGREGERGERGEGGRERKGGEEGGRERERERERERDSAYYHSSKYHKSQILIFAVKIFLDSLACAKIKHTKIRAQY